MNMGIKKYAYYIVIFIVLLCSLCSCGKVEKVDLKALSGKILIENNFNEEQGNGFLIITPNDNKKIRILSDNQYYQGIFNNNGNKVYAIPIIEYPTENDYAVIEYDNKSKDTRGILKCKLQNAQNNSEVDGIGTINYKYIKYVPGQKAISYLWGSSLYYSDIESKKDELIKNLMGVENYSWSKDGKTIIGCFDYYDKISKYNIQSKKVETLFVGSTPQYSNNGEYIAFQRENKNELYDLIIKEIKSGKEWKYSTNGLLINYSFSPDDKYVAIAERGRKILFQPQNGPIKILDFKTGATTILFKNYSGNSIDWK